MGCIDSRHREQAMSRRFMATWKNCELRVGDYRLFFVFTAEDVIEVRRVRHRREAYR